MAASLQPLKNHPAAASTNKVPTIQSLSPRRSSLKRSVSYNTAAPAPTTEDPDKPVSLSSENVNQAGCDNMLKAALTGLLNCQEVKSESRGRKVQNLLMETEKDLRRERRKSLGAHRGKAQWEIFEGKIEF
ncbi:hypothetical protein BDW59DRAFT_165236 [Aspergillus cavernicola]|uniref:Uncharacterized protein n=1 Tax=Aspergillus cavernicola TaxID=176166 RepID=A0ABR4HUC0_9EURO